MTRADRQHERETLVAAYRASGQSAKEWCFANGLRLNQLKYMIRKERTRKSNTPVSTRWLPVEVSTSAPGIHSEALLVRVGEAYIEVKPGFDPALLQDVVRVLGSC